MKKRHAWVLYCCLAFGAHAATTPTKEVVDRGAHHRTWVSSSSRTETNGEVTVITNRYTEIATGMHYEQNGQWLEAEEKIEVTPGGAEATKGQLKVSFAANLNTAGAVTLITPDNKTLRSHVLGLAYYDSQSGNAVWVSLVKDRTGAIIGDNQVVYEDAFSDINADVRYTYTRNGLEQDIILRQNDLPDPVIFGFNAESTRLEVITEFVEAPEVALTQFVIERERDPLVRQTSVDPDFKDELIHFGKMHMARGKAFSIGAQAPDVTVGKTWLPVDERVFLIEAVKLKEVEPHVQALPQAAVLRPRIDPGLVGKAQLQRAMLAGVARAQPAKPGDQMRMAALTSAPTAGFVLDYVTLVTASNYRFAADVTYYVSGGVALSGTTTFEGGTVIKFAKSGSPTITISGAGSKVVCESDQYRPVIFTAKDDNKLGDSVGGSGTPTGYYGGTYLNIDGNSIGTNTHLSNMRFAYASNAITFYMQTNSLSHVQFLNCRTAVEPWSGEVALRNVLANNIITMIGAATNSVVRGEHWTLHNVDKFYDTNSPATIYLTNSLLVTVTNFGAGYSGANNTNLASDAGVFQTTALGKHYLTNASPYRDLGTTNTALLSALAARTTFPPTSAAGAVISTNTTWTAVAWRDADAPDLGYHYDPLDYYVSSTVVSNATLTVTNAAVGFDYPSGSWGIILKNGKFLSHGAPTRLNPVVRSHMVQETGSGNPGTRAAFYDGLSSTSSNELRLRFAFTSQLPNDGYLIYVGNKLSALEWTHSAVYNATVVVDMSGSIAAGFTNNLWERSPMQLGNGSSGAGSVVQFRNNLIRHGYTHFYRGQPAWRACDNLVDTAYGLYENGVPVTNANNAYFGVASWLSAGSGTQMLASLTYVPGPLGLYYQPTNSPLLNAGSTNADYVGLYHFTTTTNQVKETNGTVDIGIHYVALDPTGNPLDYDGEGIPDFYEDVNGNGVNDAGELNWQNADTDGDGVNDLVEILQGRNPMGGVIADTNNILNLRVYTPLK